MPRKRALARDRGEIPYKNPVSYAFGLVLNRIRNETADEDVFEIERLAPRLEISASTYRLIEAGIAPVPLKCTLQLCETFGFSWKPLISVIGAIHVMEGAYDSVVGMRRSLENIATVEQNLGWTIEAFVPVWPILEGGNTGNNATAVRNALRRSVVGRLRAYLFSPSLRPAVDSTLRSAESTESGRRLAESLGSLPAPLAYAVLAFLEELAQYPLLSPLEGLPAIG
ncbi:hypothetical protein HYZ80_02665 [Candidatus Parcubacteria bacterium]|nr:hypothetical protein [Candidatus Parcubacteria bacterium]